MKRNCRRLVVFFIVVFLVHSPFVFPFHNTHSSGLVTLSTHEIRIQLKEREQVEHRLDISNSTDDLVYFSAIKTMEAIAEPKMFSLSEEETGSSWNTPRQNYQRTGFNAVESVVPPFEYKWRFQSARALRSPVVIGKNMFIPGEDGNVYRVDSRTGVFRDSISFAQVVYSLHSADRHLIAATNEGIIVYDRLSRRQLWRNDIINDNVHCFAAKDGRFYIASGHSLICINQDTGMTIWQSSGAYQSIVLGTDYLFAASSFNVLTAMHLSDGKEVFRLKFDHELQGTPLYQDGLIYLLEADSSDEQASEVVCFDYTGKRRWSYLLLDEVSAAPACDQQMLYVATVTGKLLALDRFNGTLVWEQFLKSPIHAPLTLSSDLVFVGLNNGQVHALDKASGQSIWNIDFKFPVYSELVLAQGLLYTVDNTGSMVAYGRSWENVVPPMSPENAKGYAGNSIVTLYWSVSRNEKDLAGYNIYRRSDAERDFAFIDKLPVMNQYQDNTVRNGQRYHYLVRSYDLYGNESANSSQVSLTPSEHAPPVWIDFAPNNGLIRPGENFSFTIRLKTMTLPPGFYKAYVYFILYGASIPQEWIKLELHLEVEQGTHETPGVPVIRSIDSSDTRVRLSWDNVPGSRKYLIYRSYVALDQYQLIKEVSGAATQYQDDSVRNGTRVYYTLRSESVEGVISEFSEEVSTIPNPLPLTVQLTDHAILYEPVLTVTGTSDPKAILTVNGHEARPDANGFFSVLAGIPIGSSRVLVEAKDTSGNKQSHSYSVSFHPSLLQVQLRIDDPVVQVNQHRWPYLLDAPPIIRDQRTFVPLRFLGEIIGAQVLWDAQERKVTYSYRDIQVELWIGKREIRVDGSFREIDVAPFIESGRTMVPLRFITEPMGAIIQWDPGSRIILLMFQF